MKHRHLCEIDIDYDKDLTCEPLDTGKHNVVMYYPKQNYIILKFSRYITGIELKGDDLQTNRVGPVLGNHRNTPRVCYYTCLTI